MRRAEIKPRLFDEMTVTCVDHADLVTINEFRKFSIPDPSFFQCGKIDQPDNGFILKDQTNKNAEEGICHGETPGAIYRVYHLSLIHI